ncbi:hypothetical protein MTR_4g060440 [Medicago truncatula]|uniref:Uncharacterized protein n=1 Tax=Medicago truncatula TaxID=3880 RepID=G7JQF3_MEDTR|nr:hypothetical protein MTR_4g060440 [Medicago truncatula]
MSATETNLFSTRSNSLWNLVNNGTPSNHGSFQNRVEELKEISAETPKKNSLNN